MEALPSRTDAFGHPTAWCTGQPLAAIAFMILLVPVLHYLYHDYNAYIALGPGGTPATISGYLRIKTLGIFALRGPYESGPTPKHLQGLPGYLKHLPLRGKIRPVTKGIAPHRQVTQRARTDVYQLLEAAINQTGSSCDSLVLGTSCFEKHGTGLFTISPVKRTCRGEICHAHPSDGSMHLTLHPADAKLVLEAGWGERHPLARGGWFEHFVPAGFMMIYAPTEPEDVKIVMEIVDAAAWWISGIEMARRRGKEKNDTGCVPGEEAKSYSAGLTSAILGSSAF